MFTLSLPHSRNINHFFKEGAAESVIIHDAQSEAARMSPESQRKAQEFAQKVMEAFENNPESRNAFLSSLDGIKQDIFKSPEMFRAFVNRAYEKQSLALEDMTGTQRAQKIKEFSTFIRDVMLQFANMNDMNRFTLAIQAQTQALEKKYAIVQSQTSEATGALQKEVSQS